ncbi:LytR/AlgR family response regulator transcription factor [Parachitinimonas caeni]|uniref:LytTR family DNA-binding domain-containing protein n=1 Tax=Parachitinimonas caeni TaxID=3031301 RepID=A0ABT7DRI6_9NEIS|nr:LytTR family DNA-binding domain-containing protein [Parachitinimonas caeni]MDK2122683.1 LytTR family DNA-binding domain-containing protein [Parachitinimonas caeni]
MNGPLRLLLVDDEQPALNRLQDVLADCAAEVPHQVVACASNAWEALEWLSGHRADIALLDINMPGMSGLELARHFTRLTHPPAVIFTTAYDQHAIEAFEVHAVDYLLKPIRQERLTAALQRAHRLLPPVAEALARVDSKARQYLSVSERGRVRLIPVAQVCYLKAELKYVTVRTADAEYLLEESLTHLEAEFGDKLVRIHRNCLVARSALVGFEKAVGVDGEVHWHAILKNLPDKLAVSRRQQHVIREIKKGEAAL